MKNRPHRHLPRFALGALLLFLTAASGPAAADVPPPNIIFIMSDDHANAAVSVYDGRLNHTPHMDRLAAEGKRKG